MVAAVVFLCQLLFSSASLSEAFVVTHAVHGIITFAALHWIKGKEVSVKGKEVSDLTAYQALS